MAREGLVHRMDRIDADAETRRDATASGWNSSSA